MAPTRLGALDYLHRGFVYSLAGLSVYAVVMSVLVHRDTMNRGKGLMAERERLGWPLTPKKQELTEEMEESLAEQATAIFRKRNNTS